MKRMLLTVLIFLLPISVWADIIIKHKNRFVGQYEQDWALSLIGLVVLLAINSGIIFCLKRKTK